MAQGMPCILQRSRPYETVSPQRIDSCKYSVRGAGARRFLPCISRVHGPGRRYHPVAATKESEPTATTSVTKKDDVGTVSDTLPSSSDASIGSSQDETPQIDMNSMVDKVLDKVAGAISVYAVVWGLAWLSDIDPLTMLKWNDGAPLALGIATAIPAILLIGLLFAPTIDLGLTAQQMRTIGKVDQEQEDAIFSIGNLADDASNGDPDNQPLMTPEALKQGLWLFQMHVLKPWFPAFEWSSVGFLLVASCIASFAQELLVRGLGGSALSSWYSGLLAGTTDVHNPIYWAKVFKLVNADTARWMAATSLTILQVGLSSSSAERAARFTRSSLNRLERVEAPPGMPLQRAVVQNLTIELKLGQDPKLQAEHKRILELPTAEERVVYWANMAVSGLLCGATNLSWAASGSLLGSFSTQVLVDGVVTCLQQLKATSLPEKELWDQVQKMEDEEGQTQGTENN